MSVKALKGYIVKKEDKPKGKCRKWLLKVSLGKDPITGKYPQKARAFKGTWTEAQKALREFVEELENGAVVRRNTWTFRNYVDHYIDTREANGDLTAMSLDATKKRLLSICHLLGNLKMQEITPASLNTAYAELRKGNSLSGKKLSGTSINSIHKSISTMFSFAVKEGVVGENPCAKVDAPKKDTEERKPLTSEQVQELLDKLDPAKPMELAVILCATLGLRRGEAVGLSWGDVDFLHNTVSVCHSFDRLRNLKTPKTSAGARILPMTTFTASALHKRHDTQLALYGSGPNEFVNWTPEGAVMRPETAIITGDYEKRVNPDSFSRWWRENRERLRVPTTTLHELRHSFLSIAAQRGVHPSVMQKLAGHNSPKITLDIYTHVNMDQQREAMAAMETVFGQEAQK